MDKELSGDEDKLVANWKLNESDEKKVKDSSKNEIDGKMEFSSVHAVASSLVSQYLR